MKVFDVWSLIRLPIFAKYFLCVCQKLLLPFCNLVRMNLVAFGNLYYRLVTFQGIQCHFCLKYRRMIPSWSFAHILILLGFIIEHLPHLCTCPVFPDPLSWSLFLS